MRDGSDLLILIGANDLRHFLRRGVCRIDKKLLTQEFARVKSNGTEMQSQFHRASAAVPACRDLSHGPLLLHSSRVRSLP